MKFTDTGSIVVSSKINKERVEISVTDQGIGMSPDDTKRLFSKFQQISSQQSGRPAGSGLGLYISRALAQKMGGDLWIVRSEIGKGSTFAFSLPVSGSAQALTIKAALPKGEV